MNGVLDGTKQTRSRTQGLAEEAEQDRTRYIQGLVETAQKWKEGPETIQTLGRGHDRMVPVQESRARKGSQEGGGKDEASLHGASQEMVDLKGALPLDPNGFEIQVLRAIFSIQKRRGSLIRPGHNPETWGFASRKVLAEELGIAASDGNLTRISKATIFLSKQGILRRHMRCRPGNAKGATAFLIAGWALAVRVVKKVKKVVTQAWREFDGGRQPSGGSGADVEVKPNWSLGLSQFRARFGLAG